MDSGPASKVILVDENDNQIGIEDKLLAHSNGGKLHRAISIFIFNSKGETMLQKRASTKYHTPSKWTNTCCSHPNPGESVVDASHRRLKEEMGFDCDLQEKFSFVYHAEVGNGLKENEFDHVFFGTYDKTPNPNPEEADDWKWITLENLESDIKSNPDIYTPWLKIVIDKVAKERSKQG